MKIGLRNAMSVNVTVVSNEFIDTYMAAANGEYVKVFLYLLRHEHEEVTVSAIADALNDTEADVKRALSYWKEAGVLAVEVQEERYEPAQIPAAAESAATVQPVEMSGAERMQKLAEDVEFSALLRAVQQYLGQKFKQIDCEKFAFFYDGLKMSGELLEYLVEYCVGSGHTSLRYMEKVALNWYEMGIKTREEARDYTMRFSKDISSVMKAFGLTNRNPGTAEMEFIKKWFKEYGFDCSIVVEACNRTIKTTSSASFPYADRILSGWKENGVQTLNDVQELDLRRQMAKPQQDKQTGRGGVRTGSPKSSASGNNRFRNFDERTYDYESLVWENMRKQKGGSGGGTQ